MIVNPEGGLEQPEIPPEDLNAIETIKNYILQSYQPVNDPKEADKRMSTNEIFEACSRIYHNELYFSRNDLTKWLISQGFKIWDAGDMRFEWLLKNSN